MQYNMRKVYQKCNHSTIWWEKGHTYLNKPAAFSCRFVYEGVTFLLPPGIKALKWITEKIYFP